jgi:hypothetical protein
MLYTSCCRSFTSLNVFPGRFWGYWKWDLFPDLFLDIFVIVGMEQLLIFCMLILYPTLLEVFTRSKGFLVGVLGSFKYRILSQIGIIWLFFLYQIYFFHLFISLRIQIIHWIKVERVDTLVSSLILEGILFLPIQYNVGYKFVITFMMLRCVPSVPRFFRAFIIKGCWTILAPWNGTNLIFLICCWI